MGTEVLSTLTKVFAAFALQKLVWMAGTRTASIAMLMKQRLIMTGKHFVKRKAFIKNFFLDFKLTKLMKNQLGRSLLELVRAAFILVMLR